MAANLVSIVTTHCPPAKISGASPIASASGSRAANASRLPTSIDVAKAAGVSQSSVSRYLNGKNVSEEAFEAISRAIKRLGYRPNNSARSLVTNRTNLIAVVLGDMLNGYYGEIFTTIHKALTERGQRPLIIDGRVSDKESPGQLLSEVHVDGVIVATSLIPPDQEKRILARHLPTVVINRTEMRGIDMVGTQNRHGGTLAAEHLIELGHRHISMITGPAGAEAIRERSAGFVSALSASGLSLAAEEVEVAGFDYDRAYQAAKRLMQRRSPPTAIFCHNDQIAIAALNAAMANGIRVPEDLSIMGFDDVRMAGWDRIALTTIRQPLREIAITAVELLLARLEDAGRPPRTVILPCELIRRASTSLRQSAVPPVPSGKKRIP
ncbi:MULTISPECIES: LacI family DNA-binding transcriptional regulator [unclassified Acidisoma]|jgi:LacI family transcriptional regulator|uniref:LacI family DNA-binding transcriptional regulator n=1 Tax=unclassified Acidisoma TaxID=2634065 RepID=UPI00210FD94B|nr:MULTISPECIES: LacI family DNA-binding transcriptional regulator [unclassified Acidisoma]